MARQWFIPGVGAIEEDGEEEYFIPGAGAFAEKQAAAVVDVDVLGPYGQTQPIFEVPEVVGY